MLGVGVEAEVVDGYVAALLQEGEGYGPADACRAACDDGGLAGEEIGDRHGSGAVGGLSSWVSEDKGAENAC